MKKTIFVLALNFALFAAAQSVQTLTPSQPAPTSRDVLQVPCHVLSVEGTDKGIVVQGGGIRPLLEFTKTISPPYQVDCRNGRMVVLKDKVVFEHQGQLAEFKIPVVGDFRFRVVLMDPLQP